MTSEHWLALMRRFGLRENREMFERVRAAYSEPHRHYHTVAHIEACLRELESVRYLAESDHEVEAALWFHDLVYDPRASDNERRSADLASLFFAREGVSDSAVARVRSHVLATSHNGEPKDSNSCLVVDVDLSTLGQCTETYGHFERMVRTEYLWVPWNAYRQRRAEILGSFLQRESIFFTESVRNRYEAVARVNLGRAIAVLSA